MLKLVLSRQYAGLRAAEKELRTETAALRRENERLRESLAVAQRAKVAASKQSDELRKEKERLRIKLAEAKHASEESRRSHDRLTEKLATLREENEDLLRQLRSRSPSPNGASSTSEG